MRSIMDDDDDDDDDDDEDADGVQCLTTTREGTRAERYQTTRRVQWSGESES